MPQRGQYQREGRRCTRTRVMTWQALRRTQDRTPHQPRQSDATAAHADAPAPLLAARRTYGVRWLDSAADGGPTHRWWHRTRWNLAPRHASLARQAARWRPPGTRQTQPRTRQLGWRRVWTLLPRCCDAVPRRVALGVRWRPVPGRLPELHVAAALSTTATDHATRKQACMSTGPAFRCGCLPRRYDAAPRSVRCQPDSDALMAATA